MLSTDISRHFHLYNLLISNEWKSYLIILSDAININLSIYSRDGEIISSTRNYIPICRTLQSFPTFKSICDIHCHAIKMRSIEKGKPITYKCYAKITGFSIPVGYMGENAVIMGQGSFSTYEDFLEFTKLLNLLKINNFSVTGPLKFITADHIRNACRLVNSLLNKLLQNIQENFILKKDIEKFVTISRFTSEIVSVLTNENPFQMVLNKSIELLDAEQGSLMILDEEKGVLYPEAIKTVNGSITDKFIIRKGEGIAGRVIELGESFLVKDIENDPRIMQKNRLHYKTKSFVSIPLKIADRIIGVLNISDKITGQVFNDEDLNLIQSFANQAAVVIERNMFCKQAEEFKKLSITDPLTGLYNRRYLLSRLEEEILRVERYGRPLCILMLDIDDFKSYNDTYGHPVGDKALKIVAEAVLNSVRSIDIVSRFGGDEFMIILPITDKTEAISIAERLGNDISKTEMPSSGLRMITVCIGIVSYPQDGNTIELILKNVDIALYNAKNKGRNRIEVYS